MAHLQRKRSQKGRAERDRVWKAHETLHFMVNADKHRVEAALSREADLRGLESSRRNQITGTLKDARRLDVLERENQDLRDIASRQGVRLGQIGEHIKNARLSDEQSALLLAGNSPCKMSHRNSLIGQWS